MSSFVSQGNTSRNGRLKRMDGEGKLTNANLFEVINLLTDVLTHVPGGAIARFLNQDYQVTEIGPNVPGALTPKEPTPAAEPVEPKANGKAKSQEPAA